MKLRGCPLRDCNESEADVIIALNMASIQRFKEFSISLKKQLKQRALNKDNQSIKQIENKYRPRES